MIKKFVSTFTLAPDAVNHILLTKIKQEQATILPNEKNRQQVLDAQRLSLPNKANVVSLFSGAGGLDLGLEMAGLLTEIGQPAFDNIRNNQLDYFKNRSKSLFNLIYSNDIFKEASQTYQTNFNQAIVQDTTDIRKVAQFPNCQVMVGGFPCPGFSVAGPRLIDDPRNFLYVHFIRALVQTQPDFFVAENVKGLLTLASGQVFSQIVEDFESAGYSVKAKLVNSRDYGVPELRERVILVGTHKENVLKRYHWEYNFPDPEYGENGQKHAFVTLRDAISDLPVHPDDVFTGGFSPIYLSRNRKKTWEEQSFTIQASGRQAPLWPGGDGQVKVDRNNWKLVGFNRRLSVREVARIQTFPDWFSFSKGNSIKSSLNNQLDHQYRQIGNAVPVQLAMELMLPLAQFFKDTIH